jgi:two-component system CheB/CheR fusion protein
VDERGVFVDTADSADLATRVVTVVGVGSSAGGLEALRELLSGLTANGTTAYVVAQHVSPNHDSQIVELLASSTALRVTAAVDGQVLEPDVVSVAPPQADITVDRAAIQIVTPLPGPGPRPSIDRLFTAVADTWGADGVGIVLSGTGSDGAQGLRAIRAAGGLAVAQQPESAAFDSMPRAAIDVAEPDLVLEPRDIGAALSAVAGQPRIDGDESVGSGDLSAVLAELRRLTGVDFSEFKESTLRRQIARRRAARHIATMAEYLVVLAEEPDEATRLMSNVLVTVTAFFRDPAAFAGLRAALEPYMRARGTDEPLRVWVPGCATGEEAYSVAMLFCELLGHPASVSNHLRIFATDLDETSLATARAGTYPASAVGSIPADLRARYVLEADGRAQIVSSLRDCVLFARHNIGVDPPFPRLDLVSFRNTSIYFTPALQQRALETIGFSLVPGGLLFLGATEVIPAAVSGFAVVNLGAKVFVRTREQVPLRAAGSGLSPWMKQSQARRPRGPEPIVPDRVRDLELYRSVVRSVAGPSVVLSGAHDVIEVVGDVSPYCRLAEGHLSAGVADLLRPELEAEARALLLVARTSTTPVGGGVVELPTSAGTNRQVRLSARRVPTADSEMLLLLTFEDVADSDRMRLARRVVARDPEFDEELVRLEAELLLSQETLNLSLADLEAAYEELQASSEELQASSEELQGSNEELEAANEELQATNDELSAANDELRSRGSELVRLNEDLRNIQNALTQGMVIVDADLRVTRYTPSAVRAFALIDSDIGRLLTVIPTTVAMPGLETALRDAVAGIATDDLPFSGSGLSFLARVQPYESVVGGERRGAILTMTDVTDLVRARRVAEAALSDLTEITEAIDEVVWRRDPGTLALVKISGHLSGLIGYDDAEVAASPELLDAAVLEDDRGRVTAARRSGERWSIDFRLVHRDGTAHWVAERGFLVHGQDGDIMVGTLADVSARVRAEHDASDKQLILESVFETPTVGVAILGARLQIVQANEAFARIVGREPGDIRGVLLPSLVNPIAGPGLVATGEPADGQPSQPLRLLRPDGRECWATLELRALPRPVGEATAIAVLIDATRSHVQSVRLAEQAHRDPLTGLANRSTFHDHCEQELARARRAEHRTALLWIDLDHFKDVNDRHGHSVGDAVLREAAARIDAATRAEDAVARPGGDEFAVMLGDFGTLGDLENLVERILESLRIPIRVRDAVCTVGCSIGVAVFPDDAQTVDELTTAADTAMYAAKGEGGDRYSYFQSHMTQEAERRRALRAEIAAAIREQSFTMHYQPIVSAVDGSLWGVEALVRLRREGGYAPASEFIQACEDSGQIRALAAMTFDLVRADVAEMQARSVLDLRMCVNLSVTQLEDRSLTEDIARNGIAGLGSLVVEVTESVFLPDRERALGVLTILRGLGAKVSVDDFGVGYSNFRILKVLAPDVVKLDRSFLADTTSGSVDTVLLTTAVDMAHAIGAIVVAEGVESDDDRDLATRIGADLLQGYGVAMPMPLPDLLAWIEGRSAG